MPLVPVKSLLEALSPSCISSFGEYFICSLYIESTYLFTAPHIHFLNLTDVSVYAYAVSECNILLHKINGVVFQKFPNA